MLLKEITKLTDTHPPVIPLTVYFKYFQDHILDCKHVEGLIQLGTAFSVGSLMRADEACFDQLFIIGPGGVVVLLAVLDYSYCSIERLAADIPLASTEIAIYDQLGVLSSALMCCMDHFRQKHHRSLWDPKKGIRELGVLYHLHSQKLPVRHTIRHRCLFLTNQFCRLFLKMTTSSKDLGEWI
jgi:hypothetical protein